MYRRSTSSASNALVAVMLAVMALLSPARAADVTASELQAAVRALGFMDSLQGRTTVSVGVVYRLADNSSKTTALHVASALAKLPRPGSANVAADIVASNELAETPRHFDVLYVVPGMKDSGHQIADYVRRQHAVSIANEPACLEAQYCVLMVRTTAGVEIVLDTTLAQAAQAKFSSVFTMMVKRK